MSQRRSTPAPLFNRAEDKLKLSNDVIEEAFTSRATTCRTLFHALRNPVVVLPDRIACEKKRTGAYGVRYHFVI